VHADSITKVNIYCPDLHYDFSAASDKEICRRRMSLKMDLFSTSNTLVEKNYDVHTDCLSSTVNSLIYNLENFH